MGAEKPGGPRTERQRKPEPGREIATLPADPVLGSLALSFSFFPFSPLSFFFLLFFPGKLEKNPN